MSGIRISSTAGDPIWQLCRKLDGYSLSRTLKKSMPKVKLKTATNGVQASALLGSYLPNILVLDILMPEMSGVDVVRFIQESERYANIHVLIITGLGAKSEDVNELKAMGVDRFFHKPFDAAELVATVKEIIAKNEFGKTPNESEPARA